MKKYLRCVSTDVKPNGGLTLGQRYEIIGESDSAYCIDGFGHYTKEPDRDGRSYRTWFVLETEGGEPMENVIEIDGVKYREVKRKAAVGERILRTVPGEFTDIGASGIVVSTSSDTVLAVFDHGKYQKTNGGRWHNDHNKYVVLEPITDDAERELVDLIVLQRELNGLKRQQAEFAKQIDGLTDAFAKLLVKSGMAAEVTPKPKSRDEIVAQAKRDVAELEVEGLGGKHYSTGYIVDFVVNRDKRTVVALLREPLYSTVIMRGIAKAAPGDDFSEEIGKVIALRRALKMAIPSEYLGVDVLG